MSWILRTSVLKELYRSTLHLQPFLSLLHLVTAENETFSMNLLALTNSWHFETELLGPVVSCRCFWPGQSVPPFTKTSPKPPKKALWFISSLAFWHYCFLPGCPLISMLHIRANLPSATAESRKKALHKKKTNITHVSLSFQPHPSRSLIKSGQYQLSTLHFNGKKKKNQNFALSFCFRTCVWWGQRAAIRRGCTAPSCADGKLPAHKLFWGMDLSRS